MVHMILLLVQVVLPESETPAVAVMVVIVLLS
jgi:hypothetical protein